MALTGKQKAAMLLTSLDAATAAELVKGLDAEAVRELAVELADLDKADVKSHDKSSKIVKQFHRSLKANETFKLDGFLCELLKSTVGREKTEEIQDHIQQVLCNPDSVALPGQSIRELTLILQDLDEEIRDGLLNAILCKDYLVGEMISGLMGKGKKL